MRQSCRKKGVTLKSPLYILLLLSLSLPSLFFSSCNLKPRVQPYPPARNQSKEEWVLSTFSPYRHYGAYLGNGYMGLIVGPDGTGIPTEKAGQSQISGFYSQEHMVETPRWGGVYAFLGKHPIIPFETPSEKAPIEQKKEPLKEYPVDHYSQHLDLLKGVLKTSYLHLPTQIQVNTQFLIHRVYPGLALIKVSFFKQGSVKPLTLRVPLQRGNPEGMVSSPLLGRDLKTGDFWIVETTTDGKKLATVCRLSSEDKQLTSIRLIRQPRGWIAEVTLPWQKKPASPRNHPPEDRDIFSRISLPFRRRKPERFITDITKWISVATSLEGPDPLKLARAQLEKAWRQRWSSLYEEHTEAWQRLWQKADIHIIGQGERTREEQQILRAGLFYLLSSVRPGQDHSIPPMGLSSRAWGGHIFWDADMWMFPVLSLLHPNLAHSIVEYRWKTLPGARENARKGAEAVSTRRKPPIPPPPYAGASFATESAETGREIAPAEFPRERHNVSDAALAQWNYYLLTGDKKWLAQKGYPVIQAAAQYWASRVWYNPNRDRYEILGVVSPDETAGIVNNDVYTNAGAKRTLEVAIRASQLLGKPYPPLWKRIAEKMYLPYHPREHRYIEHDGFREGRRIKQADAELIIFPLGLPMREEVKRNTLEYHQRRVSPRGPAMTDAIHSIIYAELGECSKAYQSFRKSFEEFLRPAFYLFSEKRSTDNCCFLTGYAGTLMAVLYGFGGLRFDEQGLKIKPCLPPHWKKLEVKGIHFRGKVYRLTIEQGKPYCLEEKPA